MEEALKKLGEKSKADEEAIATAQKHFHAVSAGLSSNADGEDKTLADQLMGKPLKYLHVSSVYSNLIVIGFLQKR